MAETLTDPPSGSPERRLRPARGMRWIGAAGVVLLVLGTAAWWSSSRTDFKPLLDRGRLMLVKRNYDEALKIAQEILAIEPHQPLALLLAAEAEFGSKRIDGALGYLDRIEDDGSLEAISARMKSARLYQEQLKQLEPAEAQLRRALEQKPDHTEGLEAIVYLLGLESRSGESAPWRIQLLVQNLPRNPQETMHLFSLGLAENALENPELIVEMERHSPDDPGVQIGSARIKYESRLFAPAAELARKASQGMAHPGEAFARWGYCLVELDDPQRFAEWNAALTPQALEHPGVWYARGQWAAAHHQTEVAVRCFWETVKRNSGHQKANYRLGQLLVTLGRSGEADLFLNQSLRLEEYLRVAEAAHHAGGVGDAASAGLLAEKLGLLWESYGWANVATARLPGQPEATALIERLEPQIAGLPYQRAAPGTNPADQVDLSAFPAEEITASEVVVGDPQGKSHSHGTNAAITFANIAADVGLNFDYRNAGEPKTKGLVLMYEVVGGGVGVLDYDGDGQPDLWFAQGASAFPPAEDQRESLDQLFRLQDDGSFRNVTAEAMLIEPGFSQGVGVGDVNDDGFPDVYVPNIGGNRLFINNGDGTFSDNTPPNIRGDRYSACALIADVNGDNWPDIYEANYLAGENLFTEVCGDSTGYVGSCHPQLFDPSPDQLYLNLGNGEFENISKEAGIEEHVGKGLGIVAWHNDAGEMLHIFVANDVGPNFLFVNQAEKGARPRFVEQGLISGLALNRNGKFESSMGIAAGDYNHDGLSDFFITNFDNETNTLYSQQDRFLFADLTVDSHLVEKREPYVGWGAQFIDADLDSWPDLILTNGHVNDLSHQNRPFRMPAQFLRNLGNGTFAELRASRLGPYFLEKLLGRGLARLDWNHDGREDAVVTHLDAPAALLQNTTKTPGHYFALELRGVQSPREAVGAVVRLKFGERVFTKQLTGGDGNQVSNQRRLIFGLGSGVKTGDANIDVPQAIEQMTISWPSGRTQIFDRVPIDSAWIAVEGSPSLTPAPHGAAQAVRP